MKFHWREYFPKFDSDEFKAMKELDRKLKPTGQSSKHEGAFSIYEVNS